MSSKNKHKLSIFIFRRDLRTIDNTALNEALNNSDNVIPIFVFDDRQIKNNSYKSYACMLFMINSLEELNNKIKKKTNNKSKLFFMDNGQDSIEKLIKYVGSEQNALYLNVDYTPFAKKRDNQIEKMCKKYNVDFNEFHDCLLLGTPQYTDSGTPPDNYYKKFTPFYKKFLNTKIDDPYTVKSTNYISKTSLYNLSKKQMFVKLKDIKAKIFNAQILQDLSHIVVMGGRKEAKKLLKSAENNQKHYGDNRDTLTYKTTHLSAHNKFGTVSVREVYKTFKKTNKVLIEQLFWRDFYYNIMNGDPNALSGPYNDKYNKIKWINDSSDWSAWKNGKTGFPIVDACMRQLNTENYMHNRGRMIVASFLIKDLLIDWEKGEKYFAQQLVDYDPAQNNYNWQWVAGTGPFSAPYFRVFNPWSQSKKFDPDAKYIKYWVPELKSVDPKDIHKWDTSYKNYNLKKIGYYAPIIDHDKAKEKYIKIIKNLK